MSLCGAPVSDQHSTSATTNAPIPGVEAAAWPCLALNKTNKPNVSLVVSVRGSQCRGRRLHHRRVEIAPNATTIPLATKKTFLHCYRYAAMLDTDTGAEHRNSFYAPTSAGADSWGEAGRHNGESVPVG